MPRIIYQQLRPSHATRGKHAPAHRSMPGSGYYGPGHRRTYYDSELERKAQLTCMLDPTVLDFREQWPETQYIDPRTGKLRNHTWDIALRREQGWELIFVKPIPLVLRHNQYEHFDLIRKFVRPRVAISARIMTELDINPELVDLGQMLNFAMIAEEPSLAGRVSRLIRAASAHLTVRQIVQSFIPNGLHAKQRPAILSDAYWSVVHAIAHRRAFIASHGYFNMDTLVSAEDGVVDAGANLAA